MVVVVEEVVSYLAYPEDLAVVEDLEMLILVVEEVVDLVQDPLMVVCHTDIQDKL